MKKETKILVVIGSFGDNRNPSNYALKLLSSFNDNRIKIYNGGTWKKLTSILNKVSRFDVVIWMPSVTNSRPKLVDLIKKKNPKCILVTSKRNVNNEYSTFDLIKRALKTKSNLLIEITNNTKPFVATLIDPLGNIFANKMESPGEFSNILRDRILKLKNIHRLSSSKVGEAIEVPDEIEFFDIIKHYADVYHTLIHGINPERLLGNASFRCTKGFPSFRNNDKIFVSRRDIDKRYINKEGFVAVDNNPRYVLYYGNYKPSVDTPIQLALYQSYKDINYILHSHVYIKDAPFTSNILPCGALEEIDEITKIIPTSMSSFSVNLRGHGSLVCTHNVEKLENINYYARNIPEIQEKQYCCECNDYHFFTLKTGMKTYIVKEKPITIEDTCFVCTNCKKEISNDKLDDITLNKVYDEYARLYGEDVRRKTL